MATDKQLLNVAGGINIIQAPSAPCGVLITPLNQARLQSFNLDSPTITQQPPPKNNILGSLDQCLLYLESCQVVCVWVGGGG